MAAAVELEAFAGIPGVGGIRDSLQDAYTSGYTLLSTTSFSYNWGILVGARTVISNISPRGG
eukprot:52564-Rhodomonas_salina.1